MLTMPDAERRRLLNRLSEAVRRSQRRRWLRGLSQPWQTAQMKFLRAIGYTREVRAQTFFGPRMIAVLPEHVSIPIWRYGFVEEDVCLFLLSVLPTGGRFIDVGAHFGFFTLLGAHLVGEGGRVLALEPTPTAYRILRRNVAAYPHVEVYPCAAFSEERELTLQDYGVEFSAFNSLLSMRPPGRRRPTSRTDVLVRARRVDDLVEELDWEGVDVIKIDAESSEGQVLRGLERTVQRFRPAVIIEVGDYAIEGSVESRQLITWFEDRGYAAFEAGQGRVVPHRQRERYEYANLLFLTGEHVERAKEQTWS